MGKLVNGCAILVLPCIMWECTALHHVALYCPASCGSVLHMQGMGNLVNGCVILICMAMFGLTGPTLDPIGSRNVMMIQFAVGAAVSVFMVLWRYFKLKESAVSRSGQMVYMEWSCC